MEGTLDHTIVHASDKLASGQFLAHILGVAGPRAPAHFTPVVTDNDVVLDFMTVVEVMPHHSAFTVSSARFEVAHGLVSAQDLTIYSQPDRSGEGEVYERDGQRGFSFDDPDQNLTELIERSESKARRRVQRAGGRPRPRSTAMSRRSTRSSRRAFRGTGPLGFVLDKPAWLNRFAGGLHNRTVSFADLQISRHRAERRRRRHP